MTCAIPDAHEGPDEAGWCDNPEHRACMVGTPGCSSAHAVEESCETW